MSKHSNGCLITEGYEMAWNDSLPVHFTHPEFVYIRVVGACVFATLGCPMNLGALYVLFKSLRRSTHSIFLTYLFVVELVLCVYALPVFAYDQWNMQGLGGPLFCKLHTYFYFAIQGNVPFAMLLITLNRFLVARPIPRLANVASPAKCSCLVVACVILIMLILLPPLFDFGARFQRSSITGICTSLIRPGTKLYNGLTQTALLVIPIGVMFFCYGVIMRTIQRQNARIAAVTANTGVLQLPDMQQSMRRRQHTIRVTVLSAVTVLIFAVTYTPFVLGTLFPGQLDTHLYSALATVVTFSHTVTSPVVYICGDSQLYVTWKTTFLRRPPAQEMAVATVVSPIISKTPDRGNSLSTSNREKPMAMEHAQLFEIKIPRRDSV